MSSSDQIWPKSGVLYSLLLFSQLSVWFDAADYKLARGNRSALSILNVRLCTIGSLSYCRFAVCAESSLCSALIHHYRKIVVNCTCAYSHLIINLSSWSLWHVSFICCTNTVDCFIRLLYLCNINILIGLLCLCSQLLASSSPSQSQLQTVVVPCHT